MPLDHKETMKKIVFKNKLMTLISVLLIIGFLLTSLISYYIAMTSIRNHVIYDELPLTSDNIYSEIQRDLLKPIFISSLMATDTFLRDWVILGEKKHSAITNYLREIKNTYNTFTAFFVSDFTQNYYHADGLLKKVKQGEPRDEWYYRVRDLDSDYEINLDVDMANGDALTIFVNYRVYDYAGTFIGVTGVGLQVDAVQQIITRYQDTYKRHVLFLDAQGKSQLNGKWDSNSPAYLQRLFNLKADDPLLKKIQTGDSASFKYQIDDQLVLFNTRHIDEFDWDLVVTQDKINGEEELFKALLINLAACILITIIVLFIIHYTLNSYRKDIEKLATIDKLTNIYNRQALDLVFSQWIAEQKRHPTGLGVILFDIDHFKRINDGYGHIAGDEVLKQVASISSSMIRESDIIGRWGGEEFLILIKNCDLEITYNMGEKLRFAIEQDSPMYDQQPIKTEVSVGVAMYQPGDSVETLTARVDQAMYQAKAQGRNQVVSA